MLVNRLWRRMDKVEAEKRCNHVAKTLVVKILLCVFMPLRSTIILLKAVFTDYNE